MKLADFGVSQMLNAFLVRGVGVVVAAISASSIAQTPQPESKPAPATAPAPEAKPDPKLLPWRERVPPRQMGICLGYARGATRALDLAAEMHPELTDRIKAVKARRHKWLGVGLLAVEEEFRKAGLDVEELISTKILTAEQDEKYREVIRQDVESAIESWGNFENASASMGPVSLLCSLDPAQVADPTLPINDKVLTTWSGSRDGETQSLKVDFELPVGWNAGPAPTGNIAIRVASLGGYGDEMITVYADHLPSSLTPEQESAFWEKMLDKSAFEKTGLRLIDLKETKVGHRRAVMTTISAESKAKLSQRTLLRQVAFLEGNWAITVQVMRTAYAKSGDEIPAEAPMLESLAKFEPVWNHLLGSLKFEPHEKAKTPEAPAEIGKPVEAK